ncbi:MAG: FAD-dependent oxidoreductase [Limnochordaceae bacterium]|nr:FAD-dependent oxidoreductase [Limnochordaceae bacterium]
MPNDPRNSGADLQATATTSTDTSASECAHASVTHLIIGASAAGLAALESIRETEQRQGLAPSPVAVVSEEPYPPYGRHLISYYLTGERTGDQLRYRPADYFARQQAQAWLGYRVVHIDPVQRRVTVEQVSLPRCLPAADEAGDGGGQPLRDPGVVAAAVGGSGQPGPKQAVVHYETLLLATGGEPIRPRLNDPAAVPLAVGQPPTPQAATAQDQPQGVYTFTTLADAVRLRAAILSGSVHQVVVVGGGLIGLQVAEALVRFPRPAQGQPVTVTIVELLPRLLAPVLDEEGSDRVRARAEEAGVRVLTGKAAAGLQRDGQGRLTGLELASGEVLPAQAVVLAVGVRPRLDLARQAGLACGRGITLLDGARTSDPHIFAAGDVAEGWDLAAEQQRPLPIWSNAAWQGHLAGRQMVAAVAAAVTPSASSTASPSPSPVAGLMLNAAHFFGLPVVSCGVHQPPAEKQDEYQVLTWSREGVAAASPGTKGPATGPAVPALAADPAVGTAFVRSATSANVTQIPLSRSGRPLPDRSGTEQMLAAGGWEYRKLVFRQGRLVGMMAAGPAVAGAGLISGLIRHQVEAASFGQALLERWDITALPRTLRRRWLWGEEKE